MKRLFILVLTAVILCGCGRLGKKSKRLVNNGHDYQWIIYLNSPQLVHSPDCDSCRFIRKREIKQYVDSVINERIFELLKNK